MKISLQHVSQILHLTARCFVNQRRVVLISGDTCLANGILMRKE